jgi:hypothetical protein
MHFLIDYAWQWRYGGFIRRGYEMFITATTSRQDLLTIWNENTLDLVDAFIAAGVDPDLPQTETDAIRDVIVAWIEAGDECAAS